jgi:hypothetical protein
MLAAHELSPSRFEQARVENGRQAVAAERISVVQFDEQSAAFAGDAEIDPEARRHSGERARHAIEHAPVGDPE